MKQVVVLVSHFYDENNILKKYNRLKEELDEEKYDVYFLYNVHDKHSVKIPQKINCCILDNADVGMLGYTSICNKMLPGSCHFPMLLFFKQHPEYDYYWFIEYDVTFTSKWNVLMSAFESIDKDFISCHVEKYEVNKNGRWCWWSIRNNSGYSLEKSLKSFNPIFKASNAALKYVDWYQSKGFYAHEEVIVCTCLYNAGFTIADFGGDGDFVLEGFKNRFYVQYEGVNNGTMRYRPLYSLELIKSENKEAKLYHPLKEKVYNWDQDETCNSNNGS